MRRRHRANLGRASVSGLALLLGLGAALAQPLPIEAHTERDPTLGIALPQQPALRILEGDRPAEALQPPELPQVVVTVEVAPARPEAEMVTGTVAPSAQPQGGLAVLEVQPPPATTPGVDDRLAPESAPGLAIPVLAIPVLAIPAVEMPPADPALSPPAPALRAAMSGDLDIAPPVLPPVVVALPAGTELAADIASRAGEGLNVARLAERERSEILAAYQANENRPFWIEGHGWSARAKLLVAAIGRAGEDGLRAGDYSLPVFEASDKGGLAEADVRLSALAVLYARDARGGRIDPRRLSKLITPTLYLPSVTEVLSELAAVDDPGAALGAYNPPHEAYRRLKAKLAELREHLDDTPLVRIPAGPALKLGMRDDRVPLVRARLGLGPSEEPVFDRSTATALADFQKQAGLRANGILSAQTLAALGTPASARGEADIVAQMERWRWLPADLGESHIMVNVPEFMVRVVRDGRIVHETRAIVGKPETATPIFSHRMDHVIVNPSWHVPPSILKKEFLPGLAADPDYAVKRGYVVTRGRNGTLSVRQPPGERNALGWIKFMFPNDHAVYLHDTPNRRLFSSAQRAFSHGCVRVDNPFLLADQVLGPEWSTEKLRRLIGSGERRINLPAPLAIHLVYNTHVVDAAGELTTFQDLYGFHRLVKQALEPRG